MQAVYLGVSGGNRLPKTERDRFLHGFLIDGEAAVFRVSAAEDYALQNTLHIGRVYEILTEDGVVTHARFSGQSSKAPKPPIPCQPGRRTLGNLLATAMTPVGQALYLFGGGWNWQDTGAGPQATSIGAAPSWGDFFRAQDETFSYRNDAKPSGGFYPYGGWNPYYYAGLDCSAYIGWLIYNTLHTENGLPGYVCPSSHMGGNLLGREGWGTPGSGTLRPGDICSISDHVWLCLGLCEDNSVLLAHSTASESRAGYLGGGVQLSALGSGKDAQAYQLADAHMRRYAPAWSARYEAVLKDPASYLDFAPDGWFRWNLDGSGVLTDPEGFAALSAPEVMARLSGERVFPLCQS